MTKQTERLMADRLSMWTIYDHPLDYPNGYIARRWKVGGPGPDPIPTSDTFAAATLDGVRALLPPGLTRLGRLPDDDPTIVETWV
jgi:hypothetical protein